MGCLCGWLFSSINNNQKITRQVNPHVKEMAE